MALLIDTTRIGNEPTLRYTPGQTPTPVLKLSLPIEYGQRDPETRRRPTQWIDATLWGKRAESLAPYLVKGQWVYVEMTDIHLEEFDTSNGKKVSLVARIQEIKLVGGAPKEQGANEAPKQAAPSAPPPTPPEFDGFDDDIPF